MQVKHCKPSKSSWGAQVIEESNWQVGISRGQGNPQGQGSGCSGVRVGVANF